MPIFEYQCQNCGHVFEVLIRRAGSGQTPSCPQCRASKVERVLSACAARRHSGSTCASTASGIG